MRQTSCTSAAPKLIRQGIKSADAANPDPSQPVAFYRIAASEQDRSVFASSLDLSTVVDRFNIWRAQQSNTATSTPPTVLITSLTRPVSDTVIALTSKPVANAYYTPEHGTIYATSTINSRQLMINAAEESAKGAAFKTGRGGVTAHGSARNVEGMSELLTRLKKRRKGRGRKRRFVEVDEDSGYESEQRGGGTAAHSAERFFAPTRPDESLQETKIPDFQAGALIFLRCTTAPEAFRSDEARLEDKTPTPVVNESAQQPIVSSSTRFGRPVEEPCTTKRSTNVSVTSLLGVFAKAPPAAKKPRLTPANTASAKPSFQPMTSSLLGPKARSAALPNRKTLSAFNPAKRFA